jgi:AbrB family looped-hinge helix DNA binding protein
MKNSNSSDKQAQCCSVEAIISVDDRGQMVLPKDVREKAGIAPGDKLALVAFEDGGKICCMTLVKANELGGLVRHSLEPVFNATSIKEERND